MFNSALTKQQNKPIFTTRQSPVKFSIKNVFLSSVVLICFENDNIEHSHKLQSLKCVFNAETSDSNAFDQENK